MIQTAGAGNNFKSNWKNLWPRALIIPFPRKPDFTDGKKTCILNLLELPDVLKPKLIENKFIILMFYRSSQLNWKFTISIYNVHIYHNIKKRIILNDFLHGKYI